MNIISIRGLALATAAVVGFAASANAAVVRIGDADFNAGAGLITFSEFPLGTVNPTYTAANYGGDADSPTVMTGGFFAGQSLSATPGVDCAGGAPSGCVVGTPTANLALDALSPDAYITNDGAFPTSPTLTGSPRFNGPIALLFDADQLAVGFDAGYMNAIGSIGITAFARDGSLLGTVSNLGLGIEFVGLASATGVAEIAGVLFSLTGAEPAGFNIDNVRFGVAGDVTLPPDIDPSPVPLPAGFPLLLLGLGSFAALRRRK